MDYSNFYGEIVQWINDANHNAGVMGFSSDSYWEWVIKSTGEICNKNNNQELVVRQMSMLIEWLEDSWKKMETS